MEMGLSLVFLKEYDSMQDTWTSSVMSKAQYMRLLFRRIYPLRLNFDPKRLPK